jgi:hypothetical protein
MIRFAIIAAIFCALCYVAAKAVQAHYLVGG